MSSRIQELTRELKLQPHPEGGLYAEVFRASDTVQRTDGAHRSALTTIFFLWPAGSVSQWHRVMAHEVWHWYEGAPLCLHVHEGRHQPARHLMLGPVGAGKQGCARPVHVVPQGAWQAAHSLGDYTLVGCTVGPGFDFADFAMASDIPPHERPLLPPVPCDAG